jgi:hypothetical protein
MFRAQGDYLWMLCSCVQHLPLADRAVLSHRVARANEQARDAEEARRWREENREYLRNAVRNVLQTDVNTDRCDWMTDTVFGAVGVDDFAFGIRFDRRGHYPHHLVLLTEDEEIRVDSLEGLGALLIERNVVDHEANTAVQNCRATREFEADPQPLCPTLEEMYTDFGADAQEGGNPSEAALQAAVAAHQAECGECGR